MPKTSQQIDATVQEIFSLAKNSTTPISVLSLQTTVLLGTPDWAPNEVEIVGTQVLALLAKHGWKKAIAEKSPQKIAESADGVSSRKGINA